MGAGETVRLVTMARDAQGMPHKPGELLTVVRTQEKLGRAMLLVRFADEHTGYVFPEEIEA